MGHEGDLDFGRREPVARDVHDVVDPAQQREVALFVATWFRSSVLSAGIGSLPSRRMTNALIASPVTGSGPPTTAASATAGWDTRALSISVVESRWPATFMTSSTRPSSQK